MNNPPTATRTDERIAMSHWLNVIEDTDIPTPETIPITVERDSEGRPTWDTEEIINAVTDLGGEAFVRTDFKSPRSPRAQHIHQPTEEQVELTFKELVFEVGAMMKLPIGDNYYLREWLDLTWDHYTDEDCHPEVRFFIRDGDVTCWHLRTDHTTKPTSPRFLTQKTVTTSHSPKKSTNTLAWQPMHSQTQRGTQLISSSQRTMIGISPMLLLMHYTATKRKAGWV